MDLIKDSGFDMIYGVDLDINQPKMLHEGLGDTFIVGGLDPHLLATANTREVMDETKRILEKVSILNGRFILGTNDSIISGTSPANLEAVSKVVREFCCSR